MYNLNDNFKDVALSIERAGITDFLSWLFNKTDFLIAPASTKYHGNYEGGLLEHSLAVYNRLISDVDALHNYSMNTLKIVSLFHDVCKANFYSTYKRNVKNTETGIWESVDAYKICEDYPYGGHGSKSVFLIMQHGLKITDEEAAAINTHMGGWDATTYSNPSGAFNKFPLAVLLHIADMKATYLDKK